MILTALLAVGGVAAAPAEIPGVRYAWRADVRVTTDAAPVEGLAAGEECRVEGEVVAALARQFRDRSRGMVLLGDGAAVEVRAFAGGPPLSVEGGGSMSGACGGGEVLDVLWYALAAGEVGEGEPDRTAASSRAFELASLFASGAGRGGGAPVRGGSAAPDGASDAGKGRADPGVHARGGEVSFAAGGRDDGSARWRWTPSCAGAGSARRCEGPLALVAEAPLAARVGRLVAGEGTLEVTAEGSRRGAVAWEAASRRRVRTRWPGGEVEQVWDIRVTLRRDDTGPAPTVPAAAPTRAPTSAAADRAPLRLVDGTTVPGPDGPAEEGLPFVIFAPGADPTARAHAVAILVGQGTVRPVEAPP